MIFVMEQYNMIYTSLGLSPLVIGVVLLWVLFWKGCALWIAAKREEGWWFAAILVLNTVGILEIIYIFFVAKKKWSDIKEIFTKKTL